ncbi:TPA: hypothetical protein DCR49_06810 [Candidatus Delongbacteria bacterium]|nr:hypothetical protein [Candidatus Delongbacteria bacterium]
MFREHKINAEEPAEKITAGYIRKDYLSSNMIYISAALLRMAWLITTIVILELTNNFGKDIRTVLYFSAAAGITYFIASAVWKMIASFMHHSMNGRRVISNIDSKYSDLKILMLYDLNSMKDGSEIRKSAVEELSAGFLKIKGKPDFFFGTPAKNAYRKILISVAMITLIFSNSYTSSAAGRVVNYGMDFRPPASHSLKLLHPSITAAERDSVDLVCVLRGKNPGIITLKKRSVSEDTFISKEIAQAQDSIYLSRSAESSGFYYFFESHETVSDTGFVTILKRPDISSLSVTVDPPQYTRIPSKEYNEIISKISAYKGSRVTMILTPTAELDSALIRFDDGKKKYFMRSDGGTYLADLRILNNYEFSFELYSRSGDVILQNKNPVVHRIEMIKDEFPVVNIIYPEDGQMIDESLQVPVFATATDDFELSRARIFYRKMSFNEFSGKMNRTDFIDEQIELLKDSEGISVINKYFSCASLNLLPEDKVELFVRVYDNDAVSGPKFTDSKIRTVMLPSIEQLLTGSEENYINQDRILKEELEKNSAVLEKLSDISEKLKKNQKPDWEDDKKFRQIADDQERMNKSLEELQKDIQKNISILEENSIISEETMNKYMKLQKLVDELFTVEMKEKLRQLNELPELGEFDKKKYSELLQEFEDQQKQFSEGIEKSIEMLEQIKNEYMIDRLLRQIDDMITRQSEVNSAIKEKNYDISELVSKEKKIESSFGFFEKELEKLSADSNEKGFGEVMKDVKEKNLDKDFSGMKDMIGGNKQDDAGEKGSEISSKLLDTKSKLAGLKKKMLDKQKDDLKKELDEVISDLLLVSSEIEKLKNFSKDITASSSHSAEIQKKFARTESLFNEISDKIFAISKKTFFVEKSAVAQIGRISELFGQITVVMNNRYFSSSYEKNSYLMGGVNKLAVMLRDAKDEIDRSSSPSGLEEMLKKMEELAKQQADLNSRTSSMKGNSSQMSMSQMQQMMNRLAMEQAQLYDALMKMQSGMKQPGKEGSPGEDGSPSAGMPGPAAGQGGSGKDGQPGNAGAPKGGQHGSSEQMSNSGLGKKLGSAGDSMKEVEKQLKDRKLDESLTANQNQALNKLLDAIESVKREKYENKRESASGNKQAVDPGKYELKNDTDLKEMLIRSLRDGYTNKYKIKIKNYFRELEN